MSDLRLRRIDARPASPEVAEYRRRIGLSGVPQGEHEAAEELIQLCRFRNRPALLRNNLRFGRNLIAIRVSDLDGDSFNEILVVDGEQTIHTLKYQPGSDDAWSGGPGWIVGAQRYRGKILGLSFTGFGVFRRQEAIITSLEEHTDSNIYHEMKLTCDGLQWDVSELMHRRPSSEGGIRLIGDSCEPGRVPVLRAQGGRMVVEILDDRQPGRTPREAGRIIQLSGEVLGVVLCEDELVVAYARGGLQRITREGRPRQLLFPQWHFSSLAYASPRMLARQGPEGGLLIGGTTSGHVVAIDLRRGSVLWRMDAGFLFSCVALYDVESSGRIDLLLGGMDGGLRMYELTDGALIEERCNQLYRQLGGHTQPLLTGDQLVQPGNDTYPAVQLYLLSRILDSQGPASDAVVKLVRWFTPGQNGWHMLPERAQKEAISMLERFLLLHVPHVTPQEPLSTITGPFPLLSSPNAADPQSAALLTRAILAELVDIYLSAPRLVRRQIDRISRRLLEQYWIGYRQSGEPDGGEDDGDRHPLPELQRLLNVRGLRAREYAQAVCAEVEGTLRRISLLPEMMRPHTGPGSDLLSRIVRAIGLLEEARMERFSMEFERLDLSHAVLEPGDGSCWVAGIGKNGRLRMEVISVRQRAAGLERAQGGAWDPRQEASLPPVFSHEIALPGPVRFVEARRLAGGRAGPRLHLIIGTDESQATRVQLYDVSDDVTHLGEDLLIPGVADPIGFDWHGGEEKGRGEEVLLLRIPPGAEREMAAIVAVDIGSKGPRLREQALQTDLLVATANQHASLHVTASRIAWRPRAGRALSIPAPAEGRSCALDEDGRTLAVGTASGMVQLFSVVGDSLILTGQHLLPKGISALCFIPQEVFGVPALAIGSEDEQVHIFATAELRQGDELARLLVGGAPLRMSCVRYFDEREHKQSADAAGGYRLAMALSGGVAAAWDAPRRVADAAVLDGLWELASRAAGSLQRAVSAALVGPGPHARAAALRHVIRETSEPGALLGLLQGLVTENGAPGPPDGGRDGAAWPLLHPERNHIVLGVLCEALVPLAMGLGTDAQDPLHAQRARELLMQVMNLCDEPLSIRATLLRCVEASIGKHGVPSLLTWMPQLVLKDARASTWPFFVDSVGALLLQHAKRLVRMGCFDDAEEYLFGLVVTILDAVLPSLPSRFLLTKVALLLHVYLPWDRAHWAGNLGRVRLHLPHAVIAALCQPAIIPDADARAFLTAVSRRWGPRLPLIGWEDGDDLQSGFAQMSASDEGDIDWRLRVGVENGFDQTYYERLADELTRYTRPDALDAWDLADTVQAVLRLFDFRNLTELTASLQQSSVERSLQAIDSHRIGHKDPGGRYRDSAWSFLKEDTYDTERRLLQSDLSRLDRKQSKARLGRSLDEIAALLEERRVRLESQIVAELSSYVSQAVLSPDQGTLDEALVVPSGRYAACLLSVRASATAVALMMKWWDVLMEEASRIRTEADFDVRLAADLGAQDGWRTLRYAVVLSPDTTRPAHGVLITVGNCEPPEIRVRVSSNHPADLEPGRELSLYIDCPVQQAADGMRYRAEIEMRHDDGKRTERVIEGQLSRDVRGRARALFDSFAERLPTVFSQKAKRLHSLLTSPQAAVAILTSFSAHAYELLGEVLRLEWPDPPVDTFDGWRMVNLSVRHTPTVPTGLSAHGGPLTSSSLRDILQHIGARLGTALGIEGAERLDTVEAILRAVAEAPAVVSPHGAQKGLLILGLPELCDKARLEEEEQRQLLGLGARLCLCYRSRALVLLSPQSAALSLELEAMAAGPVGAQQGEDTSLRTLEMLDLDHVADPISQARSDERARAELEHALCAMLDVAYKEGGQSSSDSRFSLALLQAVHSIIDATGTDLRLIAECLPLAEQTLRERSRSPLGLSAFEGRVGNYLTPVWRALPLRHRLYLAALCCDSVEIEVGELCAGLHVDAHVHSISGKDRTPTSKVVVSAGARLDERAIEDLKKVMWLKKVRVRASLQDSRTVLWTYLRQMKPRHAQPKHHSGRVSERLLTATMTELAQLGLVRSTQLSGERQLVVFTSPAVREWLRSFLALSEGEVGLSSSVDGRNLVRQLPLWDAAAVDQILGGNSQRLRAVLGRGHTSSASATTRWHEFMELSRACRRWIEGKDEHRFVDAIADYFRLDLVEGTNWDSPGDEAQPGRVPMRSVQIRFRDQRQLPWLKRVVLYLPAGQPGRATLEQVQLDLRARVPIATGGHSGPHLQPRPDAAYSGVDWTISDTSLSAIVVVPELLGEVVSWSRNLFHVASIDVADLQHAALHDNPVEELIRRLAAAASYAALSPFRSKMGLANQELIEEMFYGRRALLEEIRGQRHENFIIVGPRKIGKTSLLQRVRFELEQQGYRVIPRGMDYTTAPDSKEVLRALIRDLMEDLEPGRYTFGPNPSLRHVVDVWGQKHLDRNIAIVLDEIDTILRTERRAYLLGEWREAGALGEALASLLPAAGSLDQRKVVQIDAALVAAGFTRDVIEGVLAGLRTEPRARRAPPLLEELRSASALVRTGGAVCRVILAGHAELAEARRDLFGPLLNFAKLRFLGPLDDASAERMVREPFARLGLRFESSAAENLLLQQTFGLPAWLQHCGALIIQSIDERLRSSRREEQRITERDEIVALERVHSEERAALQSENGLYMLGPECSFVLFALKDESWFTIDFAVEFLRCWYESLDAQHRAVISTREKDYIDAFSPEVVRRIIRDLTNTFYMVSDEVVSQEATFSSGATSAGAQNHRLERAPSGEPPRERLRRTYRVRTSMVNAVFRDELTVPKLIELARRGMRLWQEGRGVWARASGKPLQ